MDEKSTKWSRRVLRDTEFLRTSEKPMYKRIRELLLERGVDLRETLVAVMGPDDPYCEFGILVTPDRKVYEFEFYYRNVAFEDARFKEWRDLTHDWPKRARRDAIAAALSMVNQEPAA